MKIGIDIDDTTLLTIDSMFKYANRFEHQISGRIISGEELGTIKSKYYLEEIFGWNVETTNAFLNKYYKEVLNECTMLPNANTVIRKLKNGGNTIHFITARLLNIKDCDTEEITKRSMEEFNIPYDTMHLDINDKVEFARKHGIDMFVEDCYETCKNLNNVGIKSLLMTSQINAKIEDDDIIRVNSWAEVYKKINK